MPEQRPQKINLFEGQILVALKFLLVNPNVIDQSKLKQLVQGRDLPHSVMDTWCSDLATDRLGASHMSWEFGVGSKPTNLLTDWVEFLKEVDKFASTFTSERVNNPANHQCEGYIKVSSSATKIRYEVFDFWQFFTSIILSNCPNFTLWALARKFGLYNPLEY